MTDEWEDPDERENRLYVERYNFVLIEGMTLLTYTPPPRKDRRRRYVDRVKYGPEIQESTSRTIVGLLGIFGSDSSKSTIFDIYVAQAILFRFLTGAKTNDHWGRHIGEIQYGHHQG